MLILFTRASFRTTSGDPWKDARVSGSEVTAAQAKRNVTITAAIAGLAGLLFGYDTGIIAGALLTITPEFSLNSLQSGMVVGAVPIGAVARAAGSLRRR